MKYSIIILLFLNFLYAEQVVQNPLQETIKKQYKYDKTRQQMLREGRHLTKRYEDSLGKLENWEYKKEELKEKFRQKNRIGDKSFGEGNEYGKQRAYKRMKEYYSSLEKQEEHIRNRVLDNELKLFELKEEFLLRFAVPLTAIEMNGGQAPGLEDKTQKMQMLNGYIQENNLWKMCRDKIFEFDRVKSVANSIEKLFPENNLTQISILQKSKLNQQNMQKHLEQFQSIDEKYRVKYGLSILSTQRAKIILKNIEDY